MLNNVNLIGRIGQELSLKTTQSGTEVLAFSLGVQRDYNKELTDWINIVAWKGTASLIAKHFKKGDMICIEGNMQTRNYDDKDGKKVYVTEVIAEKVHFVGGKSETSATPNSNTTTTAVPTQNNEDFIQVDDDNLIF